MQLTLDQKLALIVEKHETKYLIGICEEHPDLRCFLFAPKGWHFDLNTAKLKVWAHAIVSGLQYNLTMALTTVIPA
jgi:hypothetical protein